MHRGHISFNLFYHHAKALVLAIAIGGLGFFPQIHMALHTTHFAVEAFFMWNLDDVLMAIHAVTTAVHALLELFCCDMQLAFFAIGGLPGVILPAMTPQASIITEFRVVRLGVSWCGKRDLCNGHQEYCKKQLAEGRKNRF